jgi:hypothetical protein
VAGLRQIARNCSIGTGTVTPVSFVHWSMNFLTTGSGPNKITVPMMRENKSNPGYQHLGSVTDSGTNALNNYSGIVLSSRTDIHQLTDVAERSFQHDDTMLDPEFFLASVSKGWAARVVAVYREREVVGIMYTKERIISGVPTGIVYADGSLGSIVLANPLHQQNVFRVGVETLLASPKIRGIRLRILRSGGEPGASAIRRLNAATHLDARYSRIKHDSSPVWKYHAHLSLAVSYERFLMGLGSTTRRNFRYYRRRFETSGHHLVERLSLDELRSATHALVPKSTFPNRPCHLRIENELNMVAATRQPLAIGLRHRNGEWLSVIGGWYRPRGGVLLFQHNNDRDFSSYSLSTVLRAYLIEMLIRQRLEELIVWAGTGQPLSRYVRYKPTIGVCLDVPTHLWRAARFLLSTARPWLPERLAAAAEWVVPTQRG